MLPFRGFSCLQIQGQVGAITYTPNHSVLSPHTPETRRHTLARAAPQASVKTVQRWEDGVTAACRTTCSIHLDPFLGAHAAMHMNMHTQHTRVQLSSACQHTRAHRKSANLRLAVLRRRQSFSFLCERLAWIQAH